MLVTGHLGRGLQFHPHDMLIYYRGNPCEGRSDLRSAKEERFVMLVEAVD
jgi:hypothetical protein